MKTVIFSGPQASGKTTQALALQQSISPKSEHHYSFSGYHCHWEKPFSEKVKNRDYKTVLFRGGSLDDAQKAAKILLEINFKGTFIVTTTEPVGDDSAFGNDVIVNYLQRIQGIWSHPNIMDEVNRLAEKYNGMVLEVVKHGETIAYKVVFKDSQMVVIFKNRNGGAL